MRLPEPQRRTLTPSVVTLCRELAQIGLEPRCEDCEVTDAIGASEKVGDVADDGVEGGCRPCKSSA